MSANLLNTLFNPMVNKTGSVSSVSIDDGASETLPLMTIVSVNSGRVGCVKNEASRVGHTGSAAINNSAPGTLPLITVAPGNSG